MSGLRNGSPLGRPIQAMNLVFIALLLACLTDNVKASTTEVKASSFDFDYGMLNSMFDGLRAMDKQSEAEKERVVGGLSRARLDEINNKAIAHALKVAEMDALSTHSLLEVDGQRTPSQRLLQKAKVDALEAGLDAVSEGLSQGVKPPEVVYRLSGDQSYADNQCTLTISLWTLKRCDLPWYHTLLSSRSTFPPYSHPSS